MEKGVGNSVARWKCTTFPEISLSILRLVALPNDPVEEAPWFSFLPSHPSSGSRLEWWILITANPSAVGQPAAGPCTAF